MILDYPTGFEPALFVFCYTLPALQSFLVCRNDPRYEASVLYTHSEF